MRDQMEYQIASTGSTNLEEMTDSKFNKVALNTTNVIYTAAGLETDLITKNGILPRTVQNYDKDARSIKRDNIK